jgi:hypothetical protein
MARADEDGGGRGGQILVELKLLSSATEVLGAGVLLGDDYGGGAVLHQTDGGP